MGNRLQIKDRFTLKVSSLYACQECKQVISDPQYVHNNWCPECGTWGPKAPTDPLWLTKDGELLFISQMTDSHLQYSIAKILREDNWRKHWMDKLLNELKRRKDKEREDAGRDLRTGEEDGGGAATA